MNKNKKNFITLKPVAIFTAAAITIMAGACLSQPSNAKAASRTADIKYQRQHSQVPQVRQQHPVKGKRGLAVGESGRIWQVKESDPCQELPFLFSEYV